MKRTYVSRETWRASEIDSGGSLVRTDTIHADGRVEWSVKGTADGEYVNKSGVRKIDPIPNDDVWTRIHEARLRQGWVLA